MVTLVGGVLAVGAILAWLWPLARPAEIDPLELLFDAPTRHPESADSSALTDLDLAAFRVALWNVPPSSQVPPTEAKRSEPPPKLDLIAIIEQDGQYLAALYDSTADRLHIVRSGERIGLLEITNVTSRQVELRNGPKRYQLTIELSSTLSAITDVVLAPEEATGP